MARPKKKEFDIRARVALLRASGFTTDRSPDVTVGREDMLPLSARIASILGIFQSSPIKATTMNYLILYDIEKNKIRNLVAKFLLQRGCVRIQKSVFLVRTSANNFDEIRSILAEINDIYENEDSIILVPISLSDARSMKLIGKNVNIQQIIDPPNTIFF
jgi:CRISPR-associated endonuclease Cas2